MANTTVSLIQNSDPETFMQTIADMVISGGNKGRVPTVLFSHAAITEGFHYAAVVIGPYYEGDTSDAIVSNIGQGSG
ncbi:MAG TPA: hypothetical protein VHU86_01345 [Solirubrobacterales bacterium]|jgi:hypothetical protein|nr:hypothetical protein [Solirubrobacterales bacterium]